jgi:hypothetical protein
MAEMYGRNSKHAVGPCVHLGGDVSHGIHELVTACIGVGQSSGQRCTFVSMVTMTGGQFSCVGPGLVKDGEVTYGLLQKYKSNVCKITKRCYIIIVCKIIRRSKLQSPSKAKILTGVTSIVVWSGGFRGRQRAQASFYGKKFRNDISKTPDLTSKMAEIPDDHMCPSSCW